MKKAIIACFALLILCGPTAFAQLIEGKVKSEVIVVDPTIDPIVPIVFAAGTKLPAGIPECMVAVLDKTPTYYGSFNGKDSIFTVNMTDMKSKRLVQMQFPSRLSIEEIFLSQVDEWYKTTNPTWYVVGIVESGSNQDEQTSAGQLLLKDEKRDTRSNNSGNEKLVQSTNSQSSAPIIARAIGYSKKQFVGGGEKILPLKLVKNDLYESGAEFAAYIINPFIRKGYEIRVDAIVKGSSLELANYQPVAGTTSSSSSSSSVKSAAEQKAASGSTITTGRAMR